MSMYALHKFLCQLRNDVDFQKGVQADPEAAIGELKLSDEERDAVRRGDVKTLYDMGAHAYLLQQLSSSRLFGLNRENYFPRIRGEEKVSPSP